MLYKHDVPGTLPYVLGAIFCAIRYNALLDIALIFGQYLLFIA